MSATPAIDPGGSPQDGDRSPPITAQPRGNAGINAYLRSLAPLRPAPANRAHALRCKMCGGPTRLFDCVDFHKSCHPSLVFEKSGVLVDYHRCDDCDFLFTPFCDDWTPRDFAELIYNDDYLTVDGEFLGERAVRTAHGLSSALDGAQAERILDYGSGSGTFASELARMGFSRTISYDPFTCPARPTGRFAIVTAFDVIEHSPDPAATLADMLGYMADDGCLLVGQTLQPPDIDAIRGAWWYLAPRNGHISMFSEDTIRAFAEKHTLVFDNFGAMFALSRPERSPLTSRVIARNTPIDRRAMLYAPGAVDGEPFGWHSLEEEADQIFRWTAHDEVHLGTVVVEGACELTIPIHIAIAPRFLRESRLRIGGRLLPLRARRKWLVANFSVDRRIEFAVSLLTPPPIRSPEAGSDDRREMGIAVMARPRADPA